MVLDTVAELVITVPGAVPAFTFAINVNVVVVLAAIVAFVQVSLPPAGAGQLHVPAGEVDIEVKVVFAGRTSVSVTFAAGAGPLLVTVMVYVIGLPASTGFGVAVLVTAKSACPAVATTTVVVARLLEGFGSVVLDDTFAISEITVPEGVPAFSNTTTVNVVEAPAENDPMLHDITPAVQLHPAVPDVAATETTVVFAGIVSLKSTLLAVEGPWFVTTTVYVMLEPASTGFGEAEFVIVKSAELAAPATVSTVAELFARFGSFVTDVTDAVSTICVPLTVPALTFTTTVNVAVPVAPEGTSGLVQLIVPVPFTAGVVQLHPVASAPEIAMDWKVVFTGIDSFTVAFNPSCGPAFVTVWV